MPSFLSRLSKGLSTTALAFILLGCTVGPHYQRPDLDTPLTFKETRLEPLSTNNDANLPPKNLITENTLGGQWWMLFNDETLNSLEHTAQQTNHDLHAAMARLNQARALLGNAQSARMPQVDIAFGPSRQRISPAAQGLEDHQSSNPSTLWRAQTSVAYEADLFGRVTSIVNEATANAQESEAMYRFVLLALQADVANAYFQIRELDSALHLYRNTLSSREQTLELIQHRYAAGDVSELDVARASAELQSAKAESLAAERRRTIAEHALAVLLGQSPSAFSLAAQPLTDIHVSIPAGLPSSLLERRPDIIAAERAIVAANARIGAAEAAFFPQFNLTGSAGFESTEFHNLFEWSTRTFLLGPIIGAALSLPVFDGGRRQAGLDRAQALYEEKVANYRQTVLVAFREVEDNLANLRLLSEQLSAQSAALLAAKRAAHLSHTQYQEGAISYLDVIEADRTVLTQQRLVVHLNGARAISTVNIVRALGGGWDTVVPIKH